MQEAEFQAYLHKFPVIRKRDYIKIEKNRSQAKTKTGKEAIKEAAHAQGKIVAKDTNSSSEGAPFGFWAALEANVQSEYSKPDAQKCLRSFKQVHEITLRKLCLEDLEDLAASIHSPI